MLFRQKIPKFHWFHQQIPKIHWFRKQIPKIHWFRQKKPKIHWQGVASSKDQQNPLAVPGPGPKTLIFLKKMQVFYAAAARPQRDGSATAARRERQLGPSGRPTQQEPFASCSRE